MNYKKIMILALAGTLACGTVLTGCGAADMEKTVATINGQQISLGVANFMAQYTAVDYDTYYMSYFGQNMWSSDPSGSGETMTDTVKNNTLESLEEFYLLEQHMEDYQVSLTEEELAEIQAAADQFVADNTEEALEKLCAGNVEYVKEFLRLNKIQKKMREAMIADVDREIPDEECAQKTFSYVRVSKTAPGTDTENVDELTDEQKAAQAKKKAEQILKHALIGSEEDSLQAAADANDANKSSCAYGTDDLVEETNSTYLELEVLQKAEQLKEGAFEKNLIETEKYFYIIRMDSLFDKEATERERESIIAEREDARYEELLTGFKETADWSINDKVWEPINFDTLYVKAQTQTETTGDTGASEESSASDAETKEDSQK